MRRGDSGNPFRKRIPAVRLSADQADRQGRVSRLALDTLGPADAIAFLNAHDDGLGGRPLDLAIASTDGFAAVERALALRRPT